MDHQHHHYKTAAKQEARHQHSSPAKHTHDTYDKHAGHHTEDFLKRFRISTILTIPVLLLSPMVQHWMGIHISFPGDKYVLLGLSTIIFVYGGMPFLKGMVSEFRAKATGMMTLVAIAISVAYVYSTAVILGLPGMDFFWELATLIDIMLLGHWLEMRSQMAASGALKSLVALLPSNVKVETDGGTKEIKLQDLQKGNIAIVEPGDKIPADGVVINGISYVNESMLTGESKPVKKEKDDKATGGSINGDGPLKVKITATGSDSYINKVINLVSQAQASKSKTQNFADKVAKWLTIISIATGVITFIYWFLIAGDTSFALERMVTVMVTACPHALGVAIPLVVAISTSLSATHGLLIRNRTAFEQAGKIKTVIFDKTGTLTLGTHEVQKIISLNDRYTPTQILQYAASVQQNSGHHIAHGFLRKSKSENLKLLPVENFNYVQGIGVSGIVDTKEIISAGPNYFLQNNLPLPVATGSINTNVETINYILIDKNPAGIITLADSIRDTSAEAISKLNKLGIDSYLLTGDNEKIAEDVSVKLGMKGFFANVLPHQKLDKLREFQQQGKLVAMTGDGINDAPALAQADIGIAIGSGTDVAAETADIILVNSDPNDVADMILFSRHTYRKMIQNLVWAAGYNVVAIPLAAGVLYPHFTLSPALGAVLMSLSTIIVAFNAQLLRLNFRKDKSI